MAITTDFDFICAKVRGMRSMLYERDQLRHLTAKTKLQDLFSELMPGKNFKNHLQFEKSLVVEHVRVLDEIRKFLKGANHELFSWLLRRYQIENIKVMLRGWIAGEKPRSLAALMVDIPPPYALPFEEMMAAGDIDAFLSLIPEKTLAEGAKKGIFYYNEKEKGFYIEAGLDCAYFMTLTDKLSYVRTVHRRNIEKLISTEITIYNLVFVLRAKFNYALPPDTVKNFIVTRKSLLSQDALQSIYELGALEEMLKYVPKNLLREEDFDLREISGVEKALWRTMYRISNRQFYLSILDMGEIVSFYYIKRIELLNLIKIAEAIRYGLSSRDIEKRLITLSN